MSQALDYPEIGHLTIIQRPVDNLKLIVLIFTPGSSRANASTGILTQGDRFLKNLRLWHKASIKLNLYATQAQTNAAAKGLKKSWNTIPNRRNRN